MKIAIISILLSFNIFAGPKNSNMSFKNKKITNLKSVLPLINVIRETADQDELLEILSSELCYNGDAFEALDNLNKILRMDTISYISFNLMDIYGEGQGQLDLEIHDRADDNTYGAVVTSCN